jgi:subtilisin family serine protease
MRPSAVAHGVLVVVGVWMGIAPAGHTQAQGDEFDVPQTAARSATVDDSARTYIVMMRGDPALTYDGGTAGIPATQPASDEKIDTTATPVRNYRAFLRGRHNSTISRAGVDQSEKLYDYTLAVNGFAIRMSADEAATMAGLPGVLSVVEDEVRHVDTISTPDFLGLTTAGGAWSQGHVGEDVVIGVVDTGIWPESHSFCDRAKPGKRGNPDVPCKGRRAYTPPAEWDGTCQKGERFKRKHCNNKLIGARYFNEGAGGDDAIKAAFPYEYLSPRDADGHGTHTASTAGGNRNVRAVVDGALLGRASGMAPRARVAAYKVCWGRGEEGGCNTSDSVAAIDQAVADGVDVINYSISGSTTSFLDPVEVAFFNSAAAGVFVAASAGNAGPGAGTVAHNSPWITTVAASTHNRTSEATLTLGDGATYTSASFQTTGTAELSLVYAGDVPASGADPADAALCFPSSIDPDAVAGTMVVCDRGVNARDEKSRVVRDAGGAAMILANTSPNSLNADLHYVPTIHVDEVARAAILTYIDADADPTGQLSPGALTRDETAPQTAVFSSRGPALASADLLKPDLTAPGVDVIASVAPPGQNGRKFNALSGTSMSSPHIAGLAAVIRSAHPDWSPAAVKSALMTSAYAVAEATPFDVGSGHVDVNPALDPGLVYNASSSDYIGFLCGTGQYVNPAQCAQLGIDPSDLNQPNIMIGELAGTQTVTRTVTNVGPTAAYQPVVDAPPGVDVVLSHDSLLLASGQTASYEVTFTTNGAPFDEWWFGSITWSDGTHQVKNTLAVRPVAIAAPGEQLNDGASGSNSIEVGFGYDGDYVAGAHGLFAAATQDGNVVDDPANDINTALDTGVGVTFHEVVVPDGTAHTRFALFDDETDGNDDLDLYVFDGAGNFVDASGSGTSEEAVNVAGPVAGTYTVVVHGWATDGPDANYTLFDWSIPTDPAADDGSLVVDVAPEAAVLGTTGTVEYSWTGLEADSRYLGALSHSDGTTVQALTLVSVTTP